VEKPASDHITTFTGIKLYPFPRRGIDIHIVDIARSLANQCRWMGHIKTHYSIAQHSVLVSLYCDPEDAISGLLHDASEAYLLDIPTPMKNDPVFDQYRILEDEVEQLIAECYSVPLGKNLPASVKTADKRVLLTEARDLRTTPYGETEEKPYSRTIRPWDADTAFDAFMTRFNQLVFYPETAKRNRDAYVGTE
jgi:5'-deoxynucleotidase YfbR-like HD superfamily hydrolase